MADYKGPDAKNIQALKDIANKLRIHSINATNASKSGHPTSCCSMAEIMSVLFFHTMKYSVRQPKGPHSDRFILSKGHAAPILYAAWAEAGLFPTSELMNLRKIDNDLEGHPTPRLDFIDVATGSLGQGLSVAVGMAYTGKHFDKASYRVYSLIGDGESAEGSIWEALAFSSHYKLDNLVCILDCNRLGQSDPTSLQHDMATYSKRFDAFGWHTIVVDGHDVEALCKAFYEASTVKGKPTAILAQTFKGKGCLPEIENHMNWHGKALGPKGDECISVINELISNKGHHGRSPIAPTADAPALNAGPVKFCSALDYEAGKTIATREAYGNGLVRIGGDSRVIALDGDMKNSTFSQTFMKKYPERFIECYIAEQNLIGVAIGCGCRGRTIPFASTFACFLSRAFDQIRMGAVSMTDINICGSHAGISIGEDGPSQMALEDIASFRAVQGSTVFYPSDAVSTEHAVLLAANTKGICFIRTTRLATPVIYSNDEAFEVGKAKIVHQSDNDKVTVVGCAVTLVEAVKAYDELKKEGINIRVVDPFTIKPIDAETLIACAKATGGKVITVEDHYPEGGVGEAVAGALSEETGVSVHRLAVKELPRSGKPMELLEKYGISSSAIVKAVHKVLS